MLADYTRGRQAPAAEAIGFSGRPVVMNKHHDILRFGGMISGRLPAVRSIARAPDLDGNAVADEGLRTSGHVTARRIDWRPRYRAS